MAPLSRAFSIAVSLALAALVALPTVAAQVGPIDPAVTLTLDTLDVPLGAGNVTQITGSISNTGPVDGTASLQLTLPEGWTAALDPPTEFTLTSGNSLPFTIDITAPAAGEGAQMGALEVAATLTDAAGRSAQASVSSSLTRIDPPPLVPAWYTTTAGIVGIVATVLLVVAIVAFVLWRRARNIAAARAAADAAAFLARETGISIALAGGPKQYGHKRESMLRLTLTNTSDRQRVAVVDIVEVTNGWHAGLQVSRVPLAPGESQPVTAIVTPDSVIKPGDTARVVVRARPEEARERDERLILEIVAPKSGVPTDPHYRIVTVHREGIGIKPR